MKLSDDQIKAIMEKEGKSKTILVINEEAEKIINDHLNEGWRLLKRAQINGKTKLTFVK